MKSFSFNYENKDELRHAIEHLLLQLPEKGQLQISLNEEPSAANPSLTNLWEEMGSETGGLIGRFIGASSEVTALSLQGLFLTASNALKTASQKTTADGSDQEHGEH
ncbi:hypothetical protein MFMK1_001448 [Metallumcola ferriviriculae]|uniref:Uncharacterized protein n=1 Tax=Metallumcola ferriviriculae TaxID=3039180 RepID=A0AAU0UJY7_9FIRM|nr:hypothetical protein MFMK1_001448 [Desulfitibacteraceae bacterium MK1]